MKDVAVQLDFSLCFAGHTALHHAAVGGYEEVVKALIESGANVEEQNENGHTPLMEAASAGHVAVAQILLGSGAGINTHSNEFKESALTLACYKGVCYPPIYRLPICGELSSGTCGRWYITSPVSHILYRI